MSRIFLLLAALLALSCTKSNFSESNNPSVAAKNPFPCASEVATYCSNEQGYMTWVCLKKLPPASITERCKKYLVEFPVQTKQLEDNFVEVCKPFFKGCEGTVGETRFHRQWRRECIVNKIKTVSKECKDALDTHLKSLPEAWRPKNWQP